MGDVFDFFGGRNTPGTSSTTRQRARIQQRKQPTTRFDTEDQGWVRIAGEYWWGERGSIFGIGDNKNSVTEVPAETVVERVSKQTSQSEVRSAMAPYIEEYNSYHGEELQIRDYESATGEANANANANQPARTQQEPRREPDRQEPAVTPRNATEQGDAERATSEDEVFTAYNTESESEKTRQAQEALQEIGINPGPVDGYHGDKTSNAIKQWQRRFGFEETGTLTVGQYRQIRGEI